MKIHFIFPGPPVPAQRTRSAGKRHYTPENYAEYKKALSAAIYADFGYYAWDIPPKEEAAKRRKWIKANRYRLLIDVFQDVQRGDWDNFGKTVSDAIEQAGIIANDCQIEQGFVRLFMDKSNPRIEVSMERI